MKILAYALLVLGSLIVNTADVSAQMVGYVTGYGDSYCNPNEGSYACEGRACDKAELDAQALAEYQCSSFDGINATYFKGETYTVDHYRVMGTCSHRLKYVCIH